MERRVFIAILLSFGVLYLYQAILPPPPPVPVAVTPPATTAAPPASTPAASPSAATAAPAPATTPAGDVVQASPVAAVTGESAERQVTVDTQTVEAVFSNRGGRLLHWRLKGYRDQSGTPVDLVPTEVPAAQAVPFSLRLPDRQLTARLNTALYRVSGDVAGKVDASRSPKSLVFEFEDADGLRARKEFQFQPGNYVVSVAAAVTNGAERLTPAIALGPGLSDAGAAAGGGSYFTGNAIQAPEAILNRDGKVERVTATDLATTPAHEGPFRFAGVDDHYFAAVAISPGRARIEYEPVVLPGPGTNTRTFIAQTIAPADPSTATRFFIGPKQFDLLKAADPELVRAINFGMFDVVVVQLLTSLTWLYGFIGNYGWAIVALTVIINLLMFPLRHKSSVAMRKMQDLQPQMKAIQDRYSHLKVTDPARQKMQSEVAALYKERGVNPASGCVPMLLTLPVLLAFYALLSQAIELRGAPFAGWIQDLSAPDPYYVLPGLMGITMFWQQRITPAAMDPAQQRIMMIMPVMFTAGMLFSPSGVVLYWFTSNLWTIGQQYFTNWMIGPPAARVAVDRKIKNVGTGRTAGAHRAD
jgi:YidC/Oxa1 family membrane protein insertase